ncbi:unnamed protein product [Aphanomyces euteiches]
MHIAAMVYALIWFAVFTFAKSCDLSAVSAYAPKWAAALHATAACSHFYAILSSCWYRRCQRRVGQELSVVLAHNVVNAAKFFDDWYEESIIVFNLVEIACQSHEAFKMFRTLATPSAALSYGAIVALYCFLSPLIVFVRNARTKSTLVNLTNAAISFSFS